MAFTKEAIDFNALSREEIGWTLRKYNISLTIDEILKIQNGILKRPPSLTECVLWSIQGSEHSSYRSSRPHLIQFITDGPTVIIGAKEDAGIIAVAEDNNGNRYGIVISHESHNHPSQIVPYEGAATGIGGIVRDVACMGARVIAVADALRFGDITTSKTKWIHEGVVAGISGYGNPIGIPNIAGDLYYDEGYNDNCLVNVVSLGVVREDEILHSYAPQNADGYDLILVGKPTDNSGFGGASFASLELNEEEKESKKAAVQEPNAFLERHILKATYALFDLLKERNYLGRVGFKDLGAGGIACASVELADGGGYGADVYLDKVHMGMENLHPYVILCSETQERFMWVSPPEVSNIILNHYNQTYDLPNISKGAKARKIGKIRGDKRYAVYFNGEIIVDARASDVTKGLLYNREYILPEKKLTEPDIPEPDNYNETFLKILSHENIASRHPVFETYDKQVQGRIVIEAGDADAGVMQPFNNDHYPKEIRSVGIALSVDHNPRYGKIDPFWCGINSVMEAMRNVASVGATPQAVSDCLCFGNPEKPNQMGQFVESTRGVSEACKGIHLKEHPKEPVPIIAGNVSFYNESKNGAIPPSPIIACLGKMENTAQAVTSHFKRIDSVLLMLGKRKDECGGSIYYALHDELGANVPRPDLAEAEAQIFAVTDVISAGLVLACHDISEGGIAIALAEMSFRNDIGCDVNIPGELRTDKLLFSETGGFVLEVSPEKVELVKSVFSNWKLKTFEIGKTNQSQSIKINDVVNLSVKEAKEAWENGLREKL